MFHIHTPEPVLGQSRFLDVDFHDGVAHVEELHPIREQALIQHGYTVVQELVGTKLEDLTVPELRRIAVEEGLDLPKKAKKPELVAALEALPMRVLSAADAETDDLAGGVVPTSGSVENAGGTFAATEEGQGTYIPLSPERTARNSEILAQLNAAADAEE